MKTIYIVKRGYYKPMESYRVGYYLHLKAAQNKAQGQAKLLGLENPKGGDDFWQKNTWQDAHEYISIEARNMHEEEE